MDVILKDLDPRETHLAWFAQHPDVRPDGRSISALPTISCKPGIISSAEGSAMVKYGDTVVVAGIKSEVAEPSVSAPEAGFLVVNFHFASGARADVRPGPPTEETQELTDRLAAVVKRCVLDTKTLCLTPGVLSRVLYIDAVCLCDAGNTFSAALLAVMAALKNVELHCPEIDEDTGLVSINDKTRRATLEVSSWPCAFTFGVLSKDNEELAACGQSTCDVVVDLLSGTILETEKHAVYLEDAILFPRLGLAVKSLTEQLHGMMK